MHITGLAKVNPKIIFLSGIVVLLPKAASVTGKSYSASTYLIPVFGLISIFLGEL